MVLRLGAMAMAKWPESDGAVNNAAGNSESAGGFEYLCFASSREGERARGEMADSGENGDAVAMPQLRRLG